MRGPGRGRSQTWGGLIWRFMVLVGQAVPQARPGCGCKSRDESPPQAAWGQDNSRVYADLVEENPVRCPHKALIPSALVPRVRPRRCGDSQLAAGDDLS